MNSTTTLLRYLNRHFAPDVWNAGLDLIKGRLVSRTNERLRKVGVIDGLAKYQFDFDRNPRFRRNGARVELRLPGSGSHRFTSDVAIEDPLPDPSIDIKASILLALGANAPTLTSRLSFDIDAGGVMKLLASALLGPAGPAVLSAGTNAAEDAIAKEVFGEFMSQITDAFGSYRFRRAPLTTQSTAAMTLASTKSLDVKMRSRGFLDIVLVADGFTSSKTRDFENFVDHVVDFFERGDAPEPFQSFRSSIRIWKLPLVVGNSQDAVQRFGLLQQVGSSHIMNFANLARVAEVGIQAESGFGRQPIFAFVSRNAAGASTAQGRYVLLNYYKSGSEQNAAKTLIHELGHTPLGGILGDEYVLPGAVTTYYGPEPRPRNVSRPKSWMTKWSPFVGGSFSPKEGAYLGHRGILSFAGSCWMNNHLTAAEFCDVCREELVLGMLDFGHNDVGVGATRGFVVLSVEHVRPWRAQSNLKIEGGTTAKVEALSIGSTIVVLRVIACSLPEDWVVRWGIQDEIGPTYLRHSRTAYGPSVNISASAGTSVSVEVHHDQARGRLVYARTGMPTFSGRVDFVDTSPTSLESPGSFEQSVRLGGEITLEIDPVSGDVVWPVDRDTNARNIWLRVTAKGFPEGIDLGSYVRFELERRGGDVLDYERFARRDEAVRWRVREVLSPGRYTWRARHLSIVGNQAKTSPWKSAPRSNGFSFRVLPPSFSAVPEPPLKPFAARVLFAATGTFPSPANLVAKSWHPNDKRLKFEFEFKRENVGNWSDSRTRKSSTALLSRDRRNVRSVAIAGSVSIPFSLAPGLYDWRVRATDERGNSTRWVTGPRFQKELTEPPTRPGRGWRPGMP